MTVLTILIVLAALATLVSLAGGIVSMVRGGAFDREHSTQLMVARLASQGIAFALMLVALVVANF